MNDFTKIVRAMLVATMLNGCGGSGTTTGSPQQQGAANGAAGAGPSSVPATTGTSAPSAPGAIATPLGSASGAPASSSPSPLSSSGTSIASGGPLCLPISPAAMLAPPVSLRFGIDTGAAGNLVPVTTTTPKPVNSDDEAAALAGLRPANGKLVIRLNRLFWSGGDALLAQFASEANHYAQLGYDVEVQVRYMPPTGDVDDIKDWVTYVRHVVDVLGANANLVALTITNEVNFDVSPNTSDGVYPGADDALIQGIEAAADEAQTDGYGSRIKMGFTFAYRLDPATDAGLFSYIKSTGGAAFGHAVGFVGLDDYPGTVYPPAFPPGDTAASEMGEAIATMRDCYLPLGGIATSVPLWVTENGYSSSKSVATQASNLTGTIDEVRSLDASYNVTDYRWFNLRDNDSSGTGTFDQDGLLFDTYAAKPSYSAFQKELATP